jgi:hypothetical protein
MAAAMSNSPLDIFNPRPIMQILLSSIFARQSTYKLAGDTIEWPITISQGADCIPRLRSSTVQIYSVSIAEKTKSGELVLVGLGFGYFAQPGFNGTDTLILIVVGKNGHDEAVHGANYRLRPNNGVGFNSASSLTLQ